MLFTCGVTGEELVKRVKAVGSAIFSWLVGAGVTGSTFNLWFLSVNLLQFFQ